MARIPPSLRSEYSLFRPVQTRWNDNDLYGHMNNAVHYQLFDTAVNGWLIEQGLLTFGAETAFIVAETGCRYHGDLMFPEMIQAGLRIERLGGSSVVWQIGLFREDAQESAADGRFVHVHVTSEGHKPTPIRDDQRDKLLPLVKAG